jgi:hypothetical protein
VWALSRHFVPRPGGESFFAERMTVRVSPRAAMNDPISPYRPHAKVAHRADPDISITTGAHYVASRLLPLPNWHPADSLHFPYRTCAQYVRKCTRPIRSIGQLGQYVRGALAEAEGRATEVYGSMVVDDDALERGLEDGRLVIDVRLRDALRDPGRSSRGSDRIGLDRGTVDESAALREAEIVRLNRTTDSLLRRVASVESRSLIPRVWRSS